MVGLEVLEGPRTAEYLQEGSQSALRQEEVWKLPLRPPRRRREDLSGHTWWSSHLQMCVCPYRRFLGRMKKKQKTNTSPAVKSCTASAQNPSLVTPPAQCSCRRSRRRHPCSASPAGRPGTSPRPRGPGHTAPSSRRPPARRRAAWLLPPGSCSAPAPPSGCRLPHSAAPPAARCPGSGSCT